MKPITKLAVTVAVFTPLYLFAGWSLWAILSIPVSALSDYLRTPLAAMFIYSIVVLPIAAVFLQPHRNEERIE